jgi:predicted metalloprotease with PDZ domain
MYKKTFTIISCLLLVIISIAQHPLKHHTDAIETRYSDKQPVIHYMLSVDTADLTFFSIEIRLHNIPDTFRIAMVTHPEYDDRFWRFVEDLHVETKTGNGNILREDSALWRIVTKGDEAIIRYRIHLLAPQQGQRPSWTPFLSSTGGLVGGPHSFMYVVGYILAPSHVTIKVPANWEIATGLPSTSDPATFFAPSVFVLTDCPVLVGKLKSWSFNVDGVPHHVVYWLSPNEKPFDATKLISSIEKLVQQAALLFGRLPYREYTFQLQDDAYGSLEHSNSVTVGVPASQLEEFFADYLGEIAHEYFHTWNLVRIRPDEYGDVSYKKSPLSKGLWFSEGFTMFYADLLLRRAGLPTEDSTRVQHLERLIRRYYNSPGNRKISSEQVSMAEYGPQGMLGDYMASSHLQGELLGTMLDFIIRDVTNGKKSIDDVMRQMMERFSGEKGFTGKDIEQIVTEVCGCDVHSFFENYVRGNKSIDLDKYLRLAGLHYTLSWVDGMGSDKKPAADYRLYSWVKPNETNTRLWITDPESCWGKAGLHTGDIIISVNGRSVRTPGDLNQLVRAAKTGDTIALEVKRPAGLSKINVFVSGYKEPVVHITEKNASAEKQKNLYEQWQQGN